MKTISITRYKCDKCKMVEDVEEGGQSKVTWRQIQLEGSTLGPAKEFQFCERCVGDTFGDEHVLGRKITENTRHLKSTEAMNDHVEDLGKKVEKLTQPMELNGGTNG